MRPQIAAFTLREEKQVYTMTYTKSKKPLTKTTKPPIMPSMPSPQDAFTSMTAKTGVTVSASRHLQGLQVFRKPPIRPITLFKKDPKMIDHEKSATSSWNTKPDEVEKESNIDLIRVGPKGASGLVIISDHVIGRYTHFVGKRTMPCIDKNCWGCENTTQRRWYGWLTVYNEKNDKIILLEITQKAYQQIEKYMEHHKTLRGAKLRACRKGGKANGQLKLEITPARHVQATLPAEIDRVEALERIWQTKRRDMIDDKPDSQTEVTDMRVTKEEFEKALQKKKDLEAGKPITRVHTKNNGQDIAKRLKEA